MDTRLVALNAEAVSAATSFLPNLQLTSIDRRLYLQRSDRCLAECTLYTVQNRSELDLAALEQVEGASLEWFAFRGDSLSNVARPPSPKKSAWCKVDTARWVKQAVGNAFYGSSSSGAHKNTQVIEEEETQTILNEKLIKRLDNTSEFLAGRNLPLFLFPRRCYERLTRDLFDSGLLICSDYRGARQQWHPYDRLRLPIVTRSDVSLKGVERLMRMESAMLEFGGREWMEWFADRAAFLDCEKTVQFYHASIAERDAAAEDERLIERLRSALREISRAPASTAAEKMRAEAFVFSTMKILDSGARLVEVEPPFQSKEAIQRLEQFIRDRRKKAQ